MLEYKPYVMKKIAIVIMMFWSVMAHAQMGQTLKGMIVDNESKFPLIGANISITLDNGNVLGAVTDIDGRYKISNVPLGRQTIVYSYIGFQDVVKSDIVFSSGKEVVIDIEMSESISTLDEVVVSARQNGQVVNEMATVSAREFSVQETNRYAGSRGEPARMASNFAGVQGADDSRNDIVIRGNTPLGVLWKLEGINMPNPNHFNIPGTGGGPVTILNNKFLSNSDFFTGAFPSEFGNAIAGVFDLRMRNGNNEKHEFSGQLGFLGTELTAEGPINKEKRSSYLAMYRYSTLQLFSFLGIQVGTDAIPQYQDAAFRLNFPGKNGSNFAVYGIGGLSTIDVVLSDIERYNPDETYLYGQNDRDQYFTSNMGLLGMNYTKPLNKNAYIKSGVAISNSSVISHHDQIFRHIDNDNYFIVDSLPAIMDYTFRENKYSFFTKLNLKSSAKSSVQAGINVDVYNLLFQDTARQVIPSELPDEPASLGNWETRWDGTGTPMLFQPYVQWKYAFNENLSMVSGLTSLYYSINDNSFSPIEPRLGFSYKKDKSRWNLGFGLHSQMQSNYLYYYGSYTDDKGAPVEYNLDMGLTKSFHSVLGFERSLGPQSRLKLETYYQYLYEIPVTEYSSSFSLVNTGAGFSRFFPDKLVNEGTGRNYGLEVTIERFFSGGIYFLITGSLFDAKYRGSDGVLRHTSFDGRYAANFLIAKEWTFKNNNVLNVGGKITTAGGRWYGPVDEEKSAQALEIIYQDETVNTLQFRPYFRADAKLNYVINAEKVSHEFSVDLVNFLGIENILTLTYAPDDPDGDFIKEEYQLGFLPIFYYKLDF